MLIFFFLLMLLINISLVVFLKKNNKKFPTGPKSLPVIGSLLSVGFNLKDAFNKWRQQYGPIVGFYLGSQRCVLLNDFDLISEAFKDDRFCGRPQQLQDVFHALFQSDETEISSGGVVFSQGDHWREQRRFVMKTLKEFGMGKSLLQNVISEEVSKLVEDFKQEASRGEPVNLKNKTNLAVVNTLWQIINGEKADLKDPQMLKVFNSTSKFIEENSLCGPVMILPWLRHVPPFSRVFQSARSSPQQMRRVTSTSISQHKETKDSETPRDFIDCYLNKMEETTDTTSSFYRDRGEGNIQRTTMDLFGAGSETTSSILSFAVLYMIRFPQIQEKVQAEIDAVIGSRSAMLEDRPRMPYTEAVIHEILRHACLNYTVPHATTEDVVFHGWNIPAGTAVYANVSWIMNDPDHWQAPELFNPDRFLSPVTGQFRKNERCIPFLVGKRYCPGQQLAHHQIFLFLTGLLQHFSFSTPLNSHTSVNIQPIVGFMHQCPEYQVIITERN